ncbi:hypothetical protein L1887_13744 [Cichorium endivia]|nr:hypothetical protein L1887_13744 [Cichorium endivia]
MPKMKTHKISMIVKKSEISISSSCSDQIIISCSSTFINVVCTVLRLEEGKECIVVGTLYKHIKLKPTILSEHSKERSVTPIAITGNFVHLDDYLVLEDESGRVNLKVNNVVALHGKETSGGDFLVEDILEAGLPPQLDLPSKSGEDKYVVLVSGLNVGSSSSNPLQLQLLVDHITSHLGDEKIVAAYDTFRSCINPHLFDVDNVRFLGISGQNINVLEKYSEAKENLEFMERTLRWRHLAPTASNTLGCYPFTDRDPFFIESCPYVYFVDQKSGKHDTHITKIDFMRVRQIKIREK